MTDKNDIKRPPLSQADLIRLIDACGAETSRWPSEPGAALRADKAVARALDEAAALDKLLAFAAPKTNAASDLALVDRIVAAAERMPRVASAHQPAAAPATTTTPRVVIDNVRKTTAIPPHRSPLAWSSRNDIRRGFAVLAASLVLGLSIGQSGIMDRAMIGFEELTGVSLTPMSQDFASVMSADTAGDEN